MREIKKKLFLSSQLSGAKRSTLLSFNRVLYLKRTKYVPNLSHLAFTILFKFRMLMQANNMCRINKLTFSTCSAVRQKKKQTAEQ